MRHGNPVRSFHLLNDQVVHLAPDELDDFIGARDVDRVGSGEGFWCFGAPPVKLGAAVAPVPAFPFAEARGDMAGGIRLVFEADRYLPAHVRFPVEGTFAGLNGSDVQRATNTAAKPGTVQKDAGIIDLTGDGGGSAVVVGFTRFQETRGNSLGMELHVMRLHPHKGPHHGLHIVVIDKMRSVTAAPLGHVGCISIEHPLASLAIDTAMVRAQIGGVDHPGAIFGGVGE